MSKPSLRDAMPQTATFIDFAREAFGADAINAEIKKGMAGLPGHFHATENGQQVGTPFADRGGWVSPDVTSPKKENHADRNRRR